ncbi:hypothetical protein BDN72DRAFT_838955 [Pluteus cervinus]|uniref:Uncharacterized protein n=1 Tax=Pluteus cervinus TaxID=181527 RepID=A0ACD3AXA1_9AGAR|nr:hypothetical protein BDN72DRAFT_838955 [Pluteus cervinus]
MSILPKVLALLAAIGAVYLGKLAINAESYQFDVWKCAKWHNQIVASIVAQSNKTIVSQKFSEVYANSEGTYPFQGSLTPSTIAFLDQLDVISNVPFTPNLAMPEPSSFWTYQITALNNPYPSAIQLYADVNNPSAGLFLDQRTHYATYFNSDEGFPRRDEWWPLEMALKRYSKLHLGGKYRLASTGQSISIQPYAKVDVAIALAHYESLVDGILFRMQSGDLTKRPLVSAQKLAEWNVRGFAADFLSQARTPTFKYIAPGITLPSDDQFDLVMRQKYGTPERKKALNPSGDLETLLLFPSETKVSEETLSAHPRDYLFSNSAGVYLRPTKEYADGFQFVTPFHLGKNGHLRRGNSPMFNSQDPVDPYWSMEGLDVLYQHGSCPFLPKHHARLASLIQLWGINVRKEHFKVGPEGVEGDMEVYKLADTQGHGGIDFDSNICWTDGVDPL